MIPAVSSPIHKSLLFGMTEEEAIVAGHQCWYNTTLMSHVPRAGAIRDTKGITKMVADANTHEVLGVSMVAVDAGEVNLEATAALQFRATIYHFIDLLHLYPTMAEALKIVASRSSKIPPNSPAVRNSFVNFEKAFKSLENDRYEDDNSVFGHGIF